MDDGDEGSIVRRTNKVAGIDLANANATIDRRADGRVTKFGLRVFLNTHRIGQCLPYIDPPASVADRSVFRRYILLEELLIPPQLGLRVLELCGRPLLLRLRVF